MPWTVFAVAPAPSHCDRNVLVDCNRLVFVANNVDGKFGRAALFNGFKCGKTAQNPTRKLLMNRKSSRAGRALGAFPERKAQRHHRRRPGPHDPTARRVGRCRAIVTAFSWNCPDETCSSWRKRDHRRGFSFERDAHPISQHTGSEKHAGFYPHPG